LGNETRLGRTAEMAMLAQGNEILQLFYGREVNGHLIDVSNQEERYNLAGRFLL